MIDKNAKDFAGGDIVVFKVGDKNYLARVVAVNKKAGRVTIERKGEPARQVPLADILGRGMLNTR